MTIAVERMLLRQLIILAILITSVKPEHKNTNYCKFDSDYSMNNDNYRYLCGKNPGERQIIITVRKHKYFNDTKQIEMECTNYTQPDYYELIANMSVVLSNENSFLTINHCSFPNVPFIKILRAFDIKPITIFAFNDAHMTDAHALTLDTYHLENLTSVEDLELQNNTIKELPEGLFKDMSNLKYLSLSRNNLQSLPDKIFDSLRNLHWVNFYNNELTSIDGRIFQKLSSLKILLLDNNKLDNLSNLTFNSLIELTYLSLKNNDMTILNDGIFDNLKNLIHLQLEDNKLTRVPETPFVHNSKLITINLRNAFDKKNFNFPSRFFAGQKSLQDLNLGYNDLTSLPKEIFQFDEKNNSLKILKLDHNLLSILDDGLFRNLTKLEILKINDNKLKSVTEKSLADLRSLQELDLSHNELTLNPTASYSPLKQCANLKEIDLNYNLLTKVYDDWRHSFNKLQTLEIQHNQLTKLTAEDFKFESSSALTVDYGYNKIESIDLTGIETYNKTNPAIFKMNGNPIKCCKALTLAKYLNDTTNVCRVQKFFVNEEVKCTEPESLQNKSLKSVDLNELRCPLHEIHPELNDFCPKTCMCNWLPKDNVLEVNCTSRGIPAFPKEIKNVDYDVALLLDKNNLTSIDCISELPENVRNRVTKLSLSDNKLKDIDDLKLFNGLKVLKLDNNQLTHLEYQQYNNFKSLKNLIKITLHNNPWICKCDEMRYLWQYIHEDYQPKILDKDNIRCPDNKNTSINSLKQDEFCERGGTFLNIIFGFSIIAMMICALISIYFAYKQEIKVWMFAHKCCRWLVTEKEIDKDKKYDAFVSFSHEDKEFVEDHLIPKLEENNEENYKLCVHYRDFVPGEFIPEQITYSVENSRRTIIVLSPNFIRSSWGQLEWRTAHLQAVKDNCARVIIIMYEPVNIEDLDHELRAYITMNTYLEWGNRYFWNNLKYALGLPVHRLSRHTRDLDMEPLQETRIRLQ